MTCYTIESPDQNIGAWHDSITLQILPRKNIGVQYIRYTSEYIPKLQICQHSLLTRKVFSWHNLSAQVFFFVSSGSSSSHLHLQVIFIVKSSSSSLDHQWIIIKFGSSLLDHHQVWIITWFGVSLDHHLISISIKAGSSLDHHHHHYFRYLNQMVLSLHSSHHRKFYRAIPFSC